MELTVYNAQKITLTDDQINRIAKTKLEKMFRHDGIDEHEGERWVYYWDDSHYHGSIPKKYVRKATPLDESLVLLIEELNRIIKG